MESIEITSGADAGDAQAPRGERSFFPIIVLVLVLGAIGWMCTDSFRARLDDTDLAAALRADATTTKAQHAAEELSKRIVEEIDKGAAPRGARVSTFYPGLIALSAMPDSEKRKAAAWAMQFDRKEPSFDAPLRALLDDKDPYVARNAASSLAVRASDAGRDVLLSMLRPYDIKAPIGGKAVIILHKGDPVASGHRIARIELAKGEAEIFSPIDGRATAVAADGTTLNEGDVIASVLSQASALHAMQALVLPGIGRREDAEAIERFLDAYRDADGKVLDQAKAAIAMLKLR